MNRIVRVPAFVLLLGAVISCTLARPLSDAADDAVSSFDRDAEVRDLLPAGNAPKKTIGGKKHMKNSSGKSDEGGFYKTYGSDAEGEKGYLKQTYSNGDHGYKTLDTFHKKDGDNYGFEKHTAFGKARGADKGARQGKSGSYSSKANGSGDHEGAGTEVDEHYAEEDGENEGYTESEGEGGGDESGEAAAYSEGGDNESYTSGGDSGHYNEGGSGSGNYGNSDGYNEHYSSGGGDEGSYGTEGSYSTDGEGAEGGDGGGFYAGEYY